MEIKDLLARVDHTLLDRCATFADIKTVLDDAMKYGAASACIPPSYVARAREYAGDRLKICTVIGFPNGYSTPAAKAAEAREAVTLGADEIDMVIDAGLVKEGNYAATLAEIRAVREVTKGKVLKVIIETCLLTEEEKIKLCKTVSESGADYIKTSTGFASGGATFEDVRLMKRFVTGGLKIKAAGGIASIADAEKFIELGADRLGTSRIIKILKKEEGHGY